MKKFPAIAIFLSLLILVTGALLFSKSPKPEITPSPSSQGAAGYEYFFSETCPHCANVQSFLDEWEGKEKISLEKKDVNGNKENSLLLTKRASECSIPANGIGVPFLYTPEGECIIGDTNIIEYFGSLDQ